MYSSFADVYDNLMNDVDYKARTDYLYSLFCRFDKTPTLLLDLACGTGSFSNEFAAKGISVIGVDVSCEMLTVAREKSCEAGLDVLYLCQDAAELDLYGTVDGAVCLMDSLNHITDYEKFCAVLEKVSLFLEPERLFIFDVNTVYKHSQVLADNTFVIENNDVYCVWQNEFERVDNTVNISLDFFVLQDGVYTREQENITERAYTENEIECALSKAGLKIEAVFEDMTTNPQSKTAERIIYVTRKVK